MTALHTDQPPLGIEDRGATGNVHVESSRLRAGHCGQVRHEARQAQAVVRALQCALRHHVLRQAQPPRRLRLVKPAHKSRSVLLGMGSKLSASLINAAHGPKGSTLVPQTLQPGDVLLQLPSYLLQPPRKTCPRIVVAR